MHTTLFSLEADRPMYYLLVIRIGRSLFLSMNKEDIVRMLDKMIFETLEEPLKTPFTAIMEAYDDPRVRFSNKSYTLIGDSIDNVPITRWDIRIRLEKIKDFVYDHATMLSEEIRFTHSGTAIVQ